MRESIEPRGAEVKKEAFMEGIKVIAVNDLESRFRAAKGERPVGVPAAHGIGVMEVQTFEALWGAPNTT